MRENVKKNICIFLYIILGVVGLFKIPFGPSFLSLVDTFYPMMIMFICLFCIANYGSKEDRIMGFHFFITFGVVLYYILLASLLEGFFKSPIFSDLSTFHIVYLIVLFIVSILAFVISSVYILNDKIREKYKYPIVPLALFDLGFVLALVLSFMTGF